VCINGIKPTKTNADEKCIDGRFFACFSPDFANVLDNETVALYQPGLPGFDVSLYGFVIVERGWRA